jgi:hypothetical protein
VNARPLPADLRVEFERVLPRVLSRLQVTQLLSGEIPTRRRLDGGELYAPSPFMSAMVDDALARLDPSVSRTGRSALSILSPGPRHEALQTLTDIRAGIRRFLTWQEEADGTWRFYGRASTLDADAASTACVALALLRANATGLSTSRRVHVLARFRAACGRYYTFATHDGRGYRSISEDGRKETGFSPGANAHVARFLTAAANQTTEPIDYLRTTIIDGGLERNSAEYADPVCEAHAMGLALVEAALPESDQARRIVVPWLLKRQREDGSYGGALITALATLTLIDLGYEGEGVSAAAESLLRTMSPQKEWDYDPYLKGGHGSGPFTSAYALSALASCANLHGDGA